MSDEPGPVADFLSVAEQVAEGYRARCRFEGVEEPETVDVRALLTGDQEPIRRFGIMVGALVPWQREIIRQAIEAEEAHVRNLIVNAPRQYGRTEAADHRKAAKKRRDEFLRARERQSWKTRR